MGFASQAARPDGRVHVAAGAPHVLGVRVGGASRTLTHGALRQASSHSRRDPCRVIVDTLSRHGLSDVASVRQWLTAEFPQPI